MSERSPPLMSTAQVPVATPSFSRYKVLRPSAAAASFSCARAIARRHR